MTDKTVCARHELAHPIDERCPYCTGPNRVVSCEPVEAVVGGHPLKSWLRQVPRDESMVKSMRSLYGPDPSTTSIGVDEDNAYGDEEDF
jgi:hypothetical protein